MSEIHPVLIKKIVIFCMTCYEHLNLTLMFQKYLLHLFVNTYMVRNHLTYTCCSVSILCGHNYVYMLIYVNTVWWAGGLYVQYTFESESVVSG